MFDQEDDSVSNNSNKKRGRTRVREVDFLRAEGNVAKGRELAPFELEVKEVMASARSPFAELAAQEERNDEREEKRVSKYRLSCVVRQVKLTPLQAECYQLIWVKKLSENQAAVKLGFSRSRVRNLKKIIRLNLLSALEKEKKWNQLAMKARFACKTEKQRKIWSLYFKEEKTISEIGRDLAMPRQAVQQLLKRILPTL